MDYRKFRKPPNNLRGLFYTKTINQFFNFEDQNFRPEKQIPNNITKRNNNIMTGKEAIDKLKEGYTLTRKAWEPHLKCKAYFSDNKTNPEHTPENQNFEHYISYYDALDNGDFFEDDWEIVNEIQ